MLLYLDAQPTRRLNPRQRQTFARLTRLYSAQHLMLEVTTAMSHPDGRHAQHVIYHCIVVLMPLAC
jgi:hypothetical protein